MMCVNESGGMDYSNKDEVQCSEQRCIWNEGRTVQTVFMRQLETQILLCHFSK